MSGPKPDRDKPRSTPFGLFERPNAAPITGIEMAAIALSLIWLALSLFFFLRAPSEGGFDGMRFIITLLGIFMPVAMIWVAATAARASRVMREESQRLQAAIDAIRQAYVAQAQRSAVGNEPQLSKRLDEIAQVTRKTETALARMQNSRPEPAPRPAAPQPEPEALDQGSLALGTPAEALSAPLARETLIRALNFPETVDDTEGFAALRAALQDRQTGQLVQAAEDVLTLLSQDGIYMDDLRPDQARPEIWRQFATGVRGREVAAMGGIRDRSSLALTNTRMKQDPIFRDAAHHFLRLFDRLLASFETDASDAELAALGNTRTARAFMLLGRVAGTFD